MAKRRGRKTQRRTRRKTAINILGVAEGIALANLGTNALFNVGIGSFLSGKVGAKPGGGITEITLKELFDTAMGGTGGVPPSMGLTKVIQKNIQGMEWSEWLKFVTIPIAFRVGRKVLGKNVINPVNRILKNNLGVKEIKL